MTTGAREYIGEQTRVHELAGKLVLPGLHDAHLHPEGVVQPDVCDLQSQAMPLEQLVPFLQELHRALRDRRGRVADRAAVVLRGRESAERALSDARRGARRGIDSKHPIILLGNDGHHGAVNSLALATAVDAKGKKVGLTRETLATVILATTASWSPWTRTVIRAAA